MKPLMPPLLITSGDTKVRVTRHDCLICSFSWRTQHRVNRHSARNAHGEVFYIDVQSQKLSVNETSLYSMLFIIVALALCYYFQKHTPSFC